MHCSFFESPDVDRQVKLWFRCMSFLLATPQIFFRFTTLVENTVIFSSCGDRSDGTGLAVYYNRQRLYAVVTTPTLRWTVYTRRVVTDETVTYAVSWSQQDGLAIYVNGDRDGKLKKPEARTKVSASTCDLVVGQTGSTFTVFVLELLQVVYLQKETIDKIGITTGAASLCLLQNSALFADCSNKLLKELSLSTCKDVNVVQ